jgi:hypothetical protein
MRRSPVFRPVRAKDRRSALYSQAEGRGFETRRPLLTLCAALVRRRLVLHRVRALAPATISDRAAAVAEACRPIYAALHARRVRV